MTRNIIHVGAESTPDSGYRAVFICFGDASGPAVADYVDGHRVVCVQSCYFIPSEPPADAAPGYEYFTPTQATVSVWPSEIQHGGPPSGLLVRAMARFPGLDPTQRFTRITIDILGGVGLGLNRVRTYLLRPGRQIAMIGADLEVELPDGGFRVAARATAWRMRATDSAAIASTPQPPMSPARSAAGPPNIGVTGTSELGVDWGTIGFIGTTETVVVPGRHGDTPALWIRPAIPLVDGEKITDLESVFTVIDVANGVGTRLRPDEWSWMNTDTTVHLIAEPRGPWVCIDADLATGTTGFGTTFADLYDDAGFLGRSAQTVVLSRAD